MLSLLSLSSFLQEGVPAHQKGFWQFLRFFNRKCWLLQVRVFNYYYYKEWTRTDQDVCRLCFHHPSLKLTFLHLSPVTGPVMARACAATISMTTRMWRGARRGSTRPRSSLRELARSSRVTTPRTGRSSCCSPSRYHADVCYQKKRTIKALMYKNKNASETTFFTSSKQVEHAAASHVFWCCGALRLDVLSQKCLSNTRPHESVCLCIEHQKLI